MTTATATKTINSTKTPMVKIISNTVSTNSKTKLTWKPSKQKVDLSLIDDPLAKAKSDLVNKKVEALTDEILSDKKYIAAINYRIANGFTLDVDLIPKFEKHPLRNYLTPEEVQRLLDHPHCVNILTKFDPRLLSPIYVVRLNGKVKLFVFDSMHTLTNVAALAKSGLWHKVNEVTGDKEIIDPENWLDFEYPCWVIDTTDESFPMVAALYRNGDGSKPWGPYDYHRVHTRSFDFYGNPGEHGEYELASKKQKLMVQENTVALPKGHSDLGMIGTFGHIESISDYKAADFTELEFILKTNNKYWKGNNDASMFGFYGNLYQGLTSMNQPTSGKVFNQFLDELHAVIKHFFVSMPGLKSSTTAAYKDWQSKQNKTTATPPFNCALAIVLKMYQRLGGKHTVTSDVNMFVYNPAPNVRIDIYDSLPLSIRQDVNTHTL